MKKTLILLLLFTNCIYIKIYGNYPKFPINELKDHPIEIEDLRENKEVLAKYFPILLTSIFYDKDYENEYGKLENVIKEQLNHEDLQIKKDLKIEIRKFDLENRDKCSFGLTTIESNIVVIDKKQNKEILNFENSEKIKTYVSDCSNIVYTITILGMFWYVPYISVKGTRSEQIDYLGNKTIGMFAKKLRETLNENKK